MKKIERLKAHALEGATWRGHDMGRWLTTEFAKLPACFCRKCGMGVVVDDNPPANSIDICGEAVALNCPGSKGRKR